MKIKKTSDSECRENSEDLLTSSMKNEEEVKDHEKIRGRTEGGEIGEKERHQGNQASESKLEKRSYLSDVTEIGSNLLLCGAVALRGNLLEDLKVTCVINATKELPDTPLPKGSERDILYLRVNIDDRIDSDILPWLDLVSDIIYQVKITGGKALVHCVAGISRSASLCLAYLIKYEGYTLHDSYFMLKSLRRIVKPNWGFFGQLVEYEKQITGKQTVSMVRSDHVNSFIPSLYEEDFRRFSKHRRR